MKTISELKYFLVGSVLVTVLVLTMPVLATYNASAGASAPDYDRYLDLYEAGIDNVQNKINALDNVGPGEQNPAVSAARGASRAADSRAINSMRRMIRTLFGACSFMAIPPDLGIQAFDCQRYVRQSKTSVTQLLTARDRAGAYTRFKALLEDLMDRIDTIQIQVQEAVDAASNEGLDEEFGDEDVE